MIPRIAVSPTGVAIGGSTATLLALTGGQRSAGLDVGIVSGRLASDGEIAHVVKPGVRLTHLPMRGRPVTRRYGVEYVARSVMKAPTLRAACGRGLVQGHSGRWEYTLATAALARRLQRPWIQTLYCPVAQNGSGGGMAPWVLRKVLSGAAAVVGISRNVVSTVQAAGLPKSQLFHIDPCFDVARCEPSGASASVRRRLELPTDAQVLLFVGNPGASKGFDLLWQAFTELARGRRNLYLVATFESHGRSGSKRAAEKVDGVTAENVRFLGVVEDIPALMEACDVLVLPFRNTHGPSDYPIPMLEAMAIGTPVVACNVGGISEVLLDGETGVLVPPEAPAELAEGISTLLEDPPLRSTIQQAARELIHERFTPQIAARSWEELYEAVSGI